MKEFYLIGDKVDRQNSEGGIWKVEGKSRIHSLSPLLYSLFRN